jgi:hypothetical protein
LVFAATFSIEAISCCPAVTLDVIVSFALTMRLAASLHHAMAS